MAEARQTIDLMWFPDQAERRRGRRPGLSVRRVVEAAVALADAEGLDAVTMRRVAQELGVTPMTLYTYVPDKAALLDLMLDRLYLDMPRGKGLDASGNEPEVREEGPGPGEEGSGRLGGEGSGRLGGEGSGRPGGEGTKARGEGLKGRRERSKERGQGPAPHGERPGPSWRDRFASIAEENRVLYENHPWAATLPASRPPLGPGLMAKYEHELSAFAGVGLDDVETDSALTYLLGFVRGSARAAADARAATARSGHSDQTWWEMHSPALELIVDPAAFPHATRIGSAAGEALGGAYNPDHAYAFGLERVLDGLGVLIERRTSDDHR